jgi:hypothetical protein
MKTIAKSGTTKSDLYEILDSLDLSRDVKIDWGYRFNKGAPMMILNLGNNITGGTHWVAVDNLNKRYFDSFGLAPPRYIPNSYEWTPLQIQNVNFGHCGQYATLFLYYSKMNEIDKFYNLFNIEN